MTEHRKIRRHSKVSALPGEIREAVHRAILSGRTYEEIATHLRELADAGKIEPEEVPSKSGLGRYGKDFLARLERLKIVQEQARAIVSEAEGNGLVMEEAATSLALNEIMTLMMSARPMAKGEEVLTPKIVAQITTAIARLQSSSATRERAKIEVRKDMEKRVKETAEVVAKEAKSGGLSEEAVRAIRERILGIAE